MKRFSKREFVARAAVSIGLAAIGQIGTGSAIAEEFASDNVFGLPAQGSNHRGALVVGGGGTLPDAVYDEFIRLAGGKQARVVLIPSAYPYDNMAHIRRRFNGWRDYELASFDFLHTDEPDESDTDEFCKPLMEATGVWFGGGAQGRLTHRYGERKVEKLLHGIVSRGGVVGGTSAGASVLSSVMIRYGTNTEAAVDRGLGLARRLIIDQHFSERGRFPRLLGVLEENLGHIGVGIDEGTAVVVRQNEVHAMGEGMATFFIGPSRAGDATAVYRLRGGESATGQLIHHVGRGVTFDLRKR